MPATEPLCESATRKNTKKSAKKIPLKNRQPKGSLRPSPNERNLPSQEVLDRFEWNRLSSVPSERAQNMLPKGSRLRKFQKGAQSGVPHDSGSRHLSSIGRIHIVSFLELLYRVQPHLHPGSTCLSMVPCASCSDSSCWTQLAQDLLQPSHGTLGTLKLFFAIGDLNLRWLITVIIKSIWFHKMSFVLC